MALDLTQLNLQALAAAAGQGTSNMHAPSVSSLDWAQLAQKSQADQMAQQLAWAQMGNQQTIQGMQNQGALDIQGLQGQQQQAQQASNQLFQGGQNDLNRGADAQQNKIRAMLEQQHLAQQGQYQQGQLALGQQQADQQGSYQDRQIAQRKEELEQEQYVNQLNAVEKLDKKEIAKMGAAGSVLTAYLQQHMNDPNVAEGANQIIDHFSKIGILDAKSAEAFKGLNPQQMTQTAMYYAVLADKAGDLKEKKGNGMRITTTNPDGSSTTIEQGIESGVQGEAQKQVQAIDISERMLDNIEKHLTDPSMLTKEGEYKAASGQAADDWPTVTKYVKGPLKAVGIDLDKNSVYDDQRDKLVTKFEAYKLQKLKELKGQRLNPDIMKSFIKSIPTIGKDDIGSVRNKIQAIRENDAIMKDAYMTSSQGGLAPNTPESNAKFKETYNTNVINKISNSQMSGAVLGGKFYTSDEINRVAKSSGRSVESLLSEGGALQ